MPKGNNPVVVLPGYLVKSYVTVINYDGVLPKGFECMCGKFFGKLILFILTGSLGVGV